MMCKTTTILLLALLGRCFTIYGQSNCGGTPNEVPPAESCPEACIYCDFNGYMGSTAGYMPNGIPPGGFCSSIQNDQWLGFVAGVSSAIFTATPSNCESGHGLQIALYASCSTAPIACNGGGQNQGTTSQSLAVSMVPGSNYFLLIDGLSGDICDFTLSVFPPNAMSGQSVGTMGPIQGPSSTLPGDTVLYEVASVANAGTYTWTGPPGTLVNGAMVPVSLPAPEGRQANLTFPLGMSGPVEICVNANNACFAGPTQCKTVELEGPAPGLIQGRVLWDINQNCIADAGDLPVPGAVVRFEGVQKRALPSKSDGSFRFFHAETASITISIDPVPGLYWTPCGNNFIVTPSIPLDTSEVDFLLQPATPCAYLQVDLGLPPFFRLCAPTKAKVKYSNKGSAAADSAYIELYIPPGLTVDSTSIPVAAQYGDTLRFDVGTVQPFQCETFYVYLKPLCDGSQLGQTKCLTAHICPDTLCPIWTGAHVELSARCTGDSTIRFKLRNTGGQATSPNLEYIIIEDIVVLHKAPFNLAPGDSMIIERPANGSTWRLEAEQEPGHPGRSMPAVAIEGCEGFASLGLINAFRQDDADDFVDIECKEIIGSYDPNLKVASPSGVGSSHLIEQYTPIEYIIHFQNTGTDTAFMVRLLDTLPNTLDMKTFRPGTSSHPCTWQFLDEYILEVLFSPIALPDSNVNEPASHGWFEFSMEPLHKLPIGTYIENSAAIYFDFNPPIITNESWHTLGKLAVSINKEPKTGERSLWRVLGNPARESCTFQSVEPISGQSRFQLTDAQGRTVRTDEFSGQQYSFERGRLAAGLYFFHIQTERDAAAAGKIMLHD